MTAKNELTGHILAGLTVVVWGTTFISTKILLTDFSPVEILFIRFLIGLCALFLFNHRKMKLHNRRHALYFAGAGLTGITLYYLLENIALTQTLTANVGVIVSIAPFFTAVLAHWFLDAEKPRPVFYIGFGVALLGILFISGAGSMQINPIGDFLCVLAAIVWAVYSILVRKISVFGYNTVQSTRHIFIYGTLFMLLTLFFLDFRPDFAMLLKPVNFLNLLFLGLGASATCFVTWNLAVKLLGAVKTSVYIYAIPVITVVTSALVLGEPLTPASVAGTLLTLGGLVISEIRPRATARSVK